VPHKTAPKSKPLYRQKTAKQEFNAKTQRREGGQRPQAIIGEDFTHAKPVPVSHFELREDGSIQSDSSLGSR
jgi:hypothetical protein